MGLKILTQLLRLIAILPLPWLHRLGWAIGRLFGMLDNRERCVTEINLELCFPELSPAERLALRNRSLEQAGRTLMEMAAIWFWPVERVLRVKQRMGLL